MKIAPEVSWRFGDLKGKKIIGTAYHMSKVSLASLAKALLNGLATSSFNTLWSPAWECENSCSKGKRAEKLENMAYDLKMQNRYR
jgi:hypothetical protein